MFPKRCESKYIRFKINITDGLENRVDASRMSKGELQHIISRLHRKLRSLEESTTCTEEGTPANNNSTCHNRPSSHITNLRKFIENLRNCLEHTIDFGDNDIACENLVRNVTRPKSTLVDDRKEMFVQQFVCQEILGKVCLAMNGLQFQGLGKLFEDIRNAYRKGIRHELTALESARYMQSCYIVRKCARKFSSIHQEARRAIACCREDRNIRIDVTLQREDNIEGIQYMHGSRVKEGGQVKSIMPATLEGAQHCAEETEYKRADNSKEEEHEGSHKDTISNANNPLSDQRDEINFGNINTTSGYFNEKVALDILGPLPETKQGNKFILIVQDCFTKFTRAYALPSQHLSLVMDTLLNTYFLVFGFPSRILTEKNDHFAYISFDDLVQNFGIHHAACTSHNNKDNNFQEYRCAAFGQYLKLNNKEKDWDNNLWTFSINYNTTPHACTGYTPIELLYSNSAQVPGEVFKNDGRIHKDRLLDLRKRLATFEVRAKKNFIGEELNCRKACAEH